MTTYSVWGGYSYSVGEEEFESIVHAAQEYVGRMAPSVTFFPLWGDVSAEEYVITTEHEGWTVADLVQIVEKEANDS